MHLTKQEQSIRRRLSFLLQGKRTNLRKVGSERISHGMRVRFNPLALLLDASLEGEYDLVQRIIYEVRRRKRIRGGDKELAHLHCKCCMNEFIMKPSLRAYA